MWFLALALAAACSSVSLAESGMPQGTTPKEDELGKEAMEEVKKQFKTIEDSEWLPKLKEMVATFGPKSERPDIEYTVEVIEPKEKKLRDAINAFTLPGGHIYVWTGLLKNARTEHEVAGVLAHEIAHNARMHVLRRLAKQRKLQLWQLLSLGAIIAGGDTSAVGLTGLYVLTGIMNGFSVENEAEADEAAIAYMVGTKYSPVGLLTFMELLRDRELRRPDMGDLGIYQTHPLTPERIEALARHLTSRGIRLNRRLTTGGPVATAEAAEGDDTKLGSRVKLGETLVCELVDDAELARAKTVAERLNRALSRNARMFSLRVSSVGGSPTVTWQGASIVTATERDAAAHGRGAEALAREWVGSLKGALMREMLSSGG